MFHTFTKAAIVAIITILFQWASVIPSRGQVSPVRIQRTYHSCGRVRLHEEYQYIRTATQLEVKNGYYKEYQCSDGRLLSHDNYKNGKLHGKCVLYSNWNDQQQPAMISYYNMGKRHGSYVSYAAWGKEREGNYVQDLREGRWVNYNEDGSREVYYCKAGLLHGFATTYGADGTMESSRYYERDKPFTGSRKTTYPNGTPRQEISYEEGQREGWTVSWYPNGELKDQTFFTKGEEEGTSLRYLENGDPDAATKIILSNLEAEEKAQQADSIKQAQEQALIQIQEQQRLAQEEAVREVAQKQRNQVAQAEKIQLDSAQALVTIAKQRRAILGDEPPAATRRLTRELYARLLDEYSLAKTTSERISCARRLVHLLDINEAILKGERPDLTKALRKDESLDKILSLAGI